MNGKSRFPGYDVLNKRDTVSWDDATREVIDARLAPAGAPRFLNDVEWRALRALCATVMPQRGDLAASPMRAGIDESSGTDQSDETLQGTSIPCAALVDTLLFEGAGDGYRNAQLPPVRDAWRIGLAALDAECKSRYGLQFAGLNADQQVDILRNMESGDLHDPAWQGMPCKLFFSARVLHDICGAYYSHPHSWSEIGFGGPANPRGYVRMNFDRRDPWEAVEAVPGNESKALRENRRVK